MILMGRPSLSVIIVMLLPAAAMERRRLSSSSVQKRGLLFGMVMSLRPAKKKGARCLAWLGWTHRASSKGRGATLSPSMKIIFVLWGLQDDFGNVMIWGICSAWMDRGSQRFH